MQNQNNKHQQQDLGTKKFNPQANPNQTQPNQTQKEQDESSMKRSSNSSNPNQTQHEKPQQGDAIKKEGLLTREQINKSEEEIDVEGSEKDTDYNAETWAKNDRIGRENMKPNKSGGV